MRELVGRISQIFAWVTWVAWALKNSTWVKKHGVGGVGGMSPKNCGVGQKKDVGAVGLRCFVKKALLKISQNLQETNYAAASS